MFIGSVHFTNIEKAYTEGIYADTPTNRKLGRVGKEYGETDSIKTDNIKLTIKDHPNKDKEINKKFKVKEVISEDGKHYGHMYYESRFNSWINTDYIDEVVYGKGGVDINDFLLGSTEEEAFNKIKQKSKKLSEAISKGEEFILKETGQKYEYGLAYKQDGKGNIIVAFEKEGGENYITFNEKEIKDVRGATFTHNHPNSRCFSKEDINLAINSGMKEIRAIAPKSQLGNITYYLKIKDTLSLEEHQTLFHIINEEDSSQREINYMRINKMSEEEQIEEIDRLNLCHSYNLFSTVFANLPKGIADKFEFGYEKR